MTRCANCGTERDDLVAEAPGCPLMCPEISDCDLALYHRAAIDDHHWGEENSERLTGVALGA